MSQLTSGIQKDISEWYNFPRSESIMLKYHDLGCHLRCVSKASPPSRKTSIHTIILSIIHIILHSNLIRIFFSSEKQQQHSPLCVDRTPLKSRRLSLGFSLVRPKVSQLLHSSLSFPARKSGCVTCHQGCISNPDVSASATDGTETREQPGHRQVTPNPWQSHPTQQCQPQLHNDKGKNEAS